MLLGLFSGITTKVPVMMRFRAALRSCRPKELLVRWTPRTESEILTGFVRYLEDWS